MQQTTSATAAKSTVPTTAQAFLNQQREASGKGAKSEAKEVKVKTKSAKTSKYADYTVEELDASMKKTNEKLAAAKAANNADDVKKYTERLEVQSKFFNEKKTAK